MQLFRTLLLLLLLFSNINATTNIPEAIWVKDSTHTGKRPDCPFSKATNNQNYLWGTLENCKKKCIQESTGKCNMVSRYGETSKLETDPYHCRFYECPDTNNFTWITQDQWGNYANECNTYIMPIRHYTIESRYQNVTQYINQTRYIDTIKYTPYQIKEPGTNSCPTGFSQIKNIDECKTAQEEVASDKSFQGIPHPEHPVSGCYYDTLHNRVYMPPDTHGIGHNHMTPICKATCENIINNTIYITRWINATRYINTTRWINKTNIINKTNWTDKINWIDRIRWINKTYWAYKTKIQWINKTKVKTNIINKINWINRTYWYYRTNWTTKIIIEKRKEKDDVQRKNTTNEEWSLINIVAAGGAGLFGLCMMSVLFYTVWHCYLKDQIEDIILERCCGDLGEYFLSCWECIGCINDWKGRLEERDDATEFTGLTEKQINVIKEAREYNQVRFDEAVQIVWEKTCAIEKKNELTNIAFNRQIELQQLAVKEEEHEEIENTIISVNPVTPRRRRRSMEI